MKGVPIYGVALDFAKAFDNVPVSITLTLLEKLGMHTRVVKPLWFMYDHLQRYFKIRGFVGTPFHATNGIMQGCPLSCLLLNALVSILTRDVLEEVPVTIQSYVDDITILSRDLDNLKQAIAALEPYLELTQQKLNVSKTYSFAVNSDAANIPFRDDFLPTAKCVKILGVRFYFDNYGVSFKYTEKDLEFVESTLAKIRGANLPFWARALVIGGSIISKISYGSELRQLTEAQERGIRNTITATLWGTKSQRRTPGVVYTLVTKGHVVDLSQCVLTSRWMKLLRAGKNDVTLLDLIHKNFNLVNARKFRLSGPGEGLVQSSRRLRLAFDTPSSIRCGDRVHDFLSCTVANLGHDLRDLGRRMVWRQVRSDAGRAKRDPEEARPHLHDIGLHCGVNRHGTMKLYNSLKDQNTMGMLRTILCNGVWTKSSRSKLPRNEGMSPICDHCGLGEPETVTHLWWVCPRWTHIRREIFDDDEDPYNNLRIVDMPRCTQTCGIFNDNGDANTDLIVKTQQMMIRIFRDRAALQEK